MAQMLPKNVSQLLPKARVITGGAILLVLALTSLQAQAQQQTTPPSDQQIDTMAVINGQPISRQHLANECVRRFGEDVLKSIIKKQLVYNECQRQGIKITCLLYTSPSPRDQRGSRMPSSA